MADDPKLPVSDKEFSASALIAFSAHLQGPLPPPEVLAKYEKLHPGATELFFKFAHEEQQHLREYENRSLEIYSKHRLRGQLFGFSIGLVALLVSAFIAVSGFYLGHPTAAAAASAIIGTGGIVSLVSVFVRDRMEKDQHSPELDKPR